MTDSPFAQPGAGGDKFEPKTFGPGVLLLIYPKAYDPAAATTFGDSAAADCDVIVVDRIDPATGVPSFFQNARLFGNLALSVRDSIGSQVLGRLGQGPNTKGNPPWILTDYTDADQALAMQAHGAYQAGQFKKATPPASAQNQMGAAVAASVDPWAGVNAAPPAQAQFPAQSAPVAAALAASAPPVDPQVLTLISKGLDANAVLAMDPATRAAVLAQLGG